MFVDDIFNYTDRGQYSFHHEFSRSITIREVENIRIINEYLFSRGNIFDGNLSNIFTGNKRILP